LTDSLRSAVLIQQPSVMDMPLVATAKCEIREVIRFLNAKKILFIDFMPPGTTINSDKYCDTLWKFRLAIQNRRRGKLSKGVTLLHDNANSYNNSCLFSDPHKTHKYSCVGRTWDYI
jgi:hypothetical protein